MRSFSSKKRASFGLVGESGGPARALARGVVRVEPGEGGQVETGRVLVPGGRGEIAEAFREREAERSAGEVWRGDSASARGPTSWWRATRADVRRRCAAARQMTRAAGAI